MDSNDLRKIATNATPGPWLYRPHQYDDWGVVRVAKKDEDGLQPMVTNAYSATYLTQHELDEHRRNKTDPCGANAQYIAAANPQAILALLDERDALTARIRQLEAEKAGAFAMGIEMAKNAVKDFSWVLPMYNDVVRNEAGDDAAETVVSQIYAALSDLSPAPGMVMVPVSEVSNG